MFIIATTAPTQFATQALLGDKPSRRSLRRAIQRFVSLRRYEQMSVHQAMQGIKLSTITAISSPGQPGMLLLSVWHALCNTPQVA